MIHIYILKEYLTSQKKDTDVPKVTNNYGAFMFEDIRYELNGVVIENLRNVGISTTLKRYVTETEYSKLSASNYGWNVLHYTPSDKSHFSLAIPLNKIFGFAEDYKKIIINAKHELVLVRARNDLNCFQCTDADTKVDILHKIEWRVKHIRLDEVTKLNLLKLLSNDRPLMIPFRTMDLYELPNIPESASMVWPIKTTTQLEKPRFIIIAFQTNHKSNYLEHASEFSHCNVEDIKVYLNNEVYPYDNLQCDFPLDKFAIAYKNFVEFRKHYYNDSMASSPLTLGQFKGIAPLYVIDCSRQVEQVKGGPIDVRVEVTFRDKIPNGTVAYCLIFHYRLVQYTPLTNLVKLM